MTEPSAIATGPSGNRRPVAKIRISAIAYLPTLSARILSPAITRRQADGFYDQIPLFYAEKQQKQPIQALTEPNATLQVIDSIKVLTKFRYAVEQRNFSARTAEFYRCSGELQRNSGEAHLARLSFRRPLPLRLLS
jgi:hypothetical protein